MTELSRFHLRLKKRCHRQRALKNLLTSVGIRVPKSFNDDEDGAPKVYCVGTLQALVDEFGEGNVRLALKLILETSEDNAECLRPSVISALTLIVAQHEYGELGLALFDAMDRVNLCDALAFARKLKRLARKDAWRRESDILVGIIGAELRRQLGELS